MIAVHLIAGDNNGGPHAEAVLDLDREAESLTDTEIDEWREAVAKLHNQAHGEYPQSIIVWIEDAPEAGKRACE